MLVRLASGSPRRLELLRQIGLEVDVYTSAFDEVSGDNAEKVVAVNALGKGQVVVEQVGSEIPVIAADTMVVLENEILGKPFDSNDAAVMLRKLSGRVHRVLTGVAVFYKAHDTTSLELFFADDTFVLSDWPDASDTAFGRYTVLYQPS
jgi:septum formation protein